jgi:hypothetical protein
MVSGLYTERDADWTSRLPVMLYSPRVHLSRVNVASTQLAYARGTSVLRVARTKRRASARSRARMAASTRCAAT